MLLRNTGKPLANKDIHELGVAAMYIASKYDDIQPLHSKVVSEKIAHKAISAKQILVKEEEFLRLVDFEMNFVTHYDFHQTYMDKIKRYFAHRYKNVKVTVKNHNMLDILSDATMFFLKLALQAVKFSKYSQSLMVICCIYASIALIE